MRPDIVLRILTMSPCELYPYSDGLCERIGGGGGSGSVSKRSASAARSTVCPVGSALEVGIGRVLAVRVVFLVADAPERTDASARRDNERPQGSDETSWKAMG